MSEIIDAVKRGDATAVAEMLERDPSLVHAEEGGVSALMLALYHGKPEIARLFAKRELTFGEACAMGDLARVQALLDSDPSLLDRHSPDGYPPVGLAIFFRQPEVARFLIERGADVNSHATNAQKVSAMNAAGAVEDIESMKLLLAHGANPNARQESDFTPMHVAAGRGNRAMIELLLAHGAERMPRSTNGKTPADIAREHDHSELAEWLERAT